jgi:hydrogenase nickel incorporation protein HypB
MFHKADLVLITKIDLAPHLEIDIDLIEENLARVMPRPAVIRVSAKTGSGIERWAAWLEERRPVPATELADFGSGSAHHHHHHHHDHHHHA